MKIAINGFGRIGRAVFKIALDRNIEVVAINDLTDVETLAHLLKYDSAYGVYKVNIETKGDALVIDGKEIKVLAERNPAKLPWGKLEVDIAIEATGIFRKASGEKGGYKDHITAGAKKVILTVPSGDTIDQTIVMGVNDDKIDLKNTAFSNASCTTNCLAPISKVLHDSFGIRHGLMNTIHSYTNDQALLDQPHSDLRRARSAALSIIPTSTGAAKAISQVIPDLEGKMHGFALRVPTPTGSVVDLTVQLEKDPSVEEVNAAMKTAAAGPMKGILKYETAPIVSRDIWGSTYSSIFDAALTLKKGAGFFKVLSWYDNEWGYSVRVIDLALKLA
ncbi:MAG: type I glyceraldehyde-3-phosphate dehydrogenase [Spirochaetota bacterium]